MQSFKIFLPISNKSEILCSDVEKLVIDKGIILVYCENEIVGSVVFLSGKEKYLISTIDYEGLYDTLEEIIKIHSEFNFHYLTDSPHDIFN